MVSHGFRNTSTWIHNWLFPAYTCLSPGSIQTKNFSMTVKTIYFCTTYWIRKSFIRQLNIKQGEFSQYKRVQKRLGIWEAASSLLVWMTTRAHSIWELRGRMKWKKWRNHPKGQQIGSMSNKNKNLKRTTLIRLSSS